MFVLSRRFRHHWLCNYWAVFIKYCTRHYRPIALLVLYKLPVKIAWALLCETDTCLQSGWRHRRFLIEPNARLESLSIQISIDWLNIPMWDSYNFQYRRRLVSNVHFKSCHVKHSCCNIPRIYRVRSLKFKVHVHQLLIPSNT